MGQPKHAQQFCGKLAPNVNCLTDETSEPYHTYGLQQGKWLGELFSLEVIKAGARAAANGASQGATIGDSKMLPGTFVVDQQGVLRYTYYSKHAGDHPPIAELIAIGKGLA